MSSPSDRVANLTPSQRALLEQRLRGIRVSPRVEAVACRPVEGSHPLSSGQRRLWFLHLLDPGSPLYNVPRAYRLRGPLDAAALRRALGAVEERHAVLRARLVERGGEPTGWSPPPTTCATSTASCARTRPAARRGSRRCCGARRGGSCGGAGSCRTRPLRTAPARCRPRRASATCG